jgi:hypothetical protein
MLFVKRICNADGIYINAASCRQVNVSRCLFAFQTPIARKHVVRFGIIFEFRINVNRGAPTKTYHDQQ